MNSAIATVTAIVASLAALCTAIVALLKAGGDVWKELRARVASNEERIEETGRVVAEQQILINKLVEKSLSDSAFRHLAGIKLLKNYEYRQNEKLGELFQREFYYLKMHGFIGPETLEFDERLNGKNVAELAKPTAVGEMYIKLRKDDVPKDWLLPEERSNLRVDVARELGLEVPDT